jgi:hypothetical protein
MVPILLRAAAGAASPGSDPSSDDLADDDDNHLTRAGPITTPHSAVDDQDPAFSHMLLNSRTYIPALA